MNYQQPGNFLQDQGYFQINTSIVELATNPNFKLFLSGQYLLELTDVCMDSQYTELFPGLPTGDTGCAILNLQSPQFSSTMSETPGITFRTPTIFVHGTTTNFYQKMSGQVKAPPNKILATLNGSIQLNLFVWEIVDGTPTAVYTPASEYFVYDEEETTFYQNVVISFGFQYSKVK
jgi:hypothetical protein